MEDSFLTVVSAASVLIVGVFVVSSVVGSVPGTGAVQTDTVNFTVEGVGADNSTVVGPVDGGLATAYDNETAESGGVGLTEGTDYEYYAENNTFVALSGGSLAAGDSVSVTLSYLALPDGMAAVVDTVGSGFTLAAVAVLVLIAALVLYYISGFGSGGSARGMRAR